MANRSGGRCNVGARLQVDAIDWYKPNCVVLNSEKILFDLNLWPKRQPHSVHCLPGSPHPAHHLITVTTHHLRSHHLSLPLPFTPDLKLISFTNPFLHSHSHSCRTAFMDLKLY